MRHSIGSMASRTTGFCLGEYGGGVGRFRQARIADRPDLRKGHINRYIGMPRDNGKAELLAGTSTFDQVVRRNILPNLDFIPTDVLPSAPLLLLQHGNLKQFLQNVSAEYDLVLLDTPPVLAVIELELCV